MIWIILIILLVIFLLWGYYSSNLLFKIPRAPLDANPKTFGFEFESFKTKTEDGIQIDGWFVPAKQKTNAAIFVLHGWGANRSDVLGLTAFLGEKFNLIYFDFRNHGTSGSGKTSLTCAEIKDFKAVVKFIRKEKNGFTQRIGVFGFSMGGSVAISGSASIPEIKAVVAESPFSSFNGTVRRYAKVIFGLPQSSVPIALFFIRMRLGFDPEPCSPIYHAAKLSPRPLFIIQGGGDVRMPISEGQTLFDAALEPKEIWIVPQADHGGIRDLAQEEYHKRVFEFFNKWI